MITRDIDSFLALARGLAADFGPPTAKAAFLVSPDAFELAEESATDNRYMADASAYRRDAALKEHRELQRALGSELPVICFGGIDGQPDGLFPNNAFATTATHSIIGRMRHPVRQREATRADIRGFLRETCGKQEIDLSRQPHVGELTGALVIDRARGIGWCGLSERCDEAGARLMHDAFGLRATLMFDLAPGEYHTNVVLAVLAGRAVIIAPAGFADPAVVAAITAFYAPHVLELDAAQRDSFSGNAISLASDSVWMSQAGAAALRPAQVATLEAAGLALRAVPLSAIEAAGGSLRCCVAELY